MYIRYRVKYNTVWLSLLRLHINYLSKRDYFLKMKILHINYVKKIAIGEQLWLLVYLYFLISCVSMVASVSTMSRKFYAIYQQRKNKAIQIIDGTWYQIPSCRCQNKTTPPSMQNCVLEQCRFNLFT